MIISTKADKVNSNRQIAAILREILINEDPGDQDKEHFWAVGLDSQNYIKYIELVCLGVSTYVPVEPKETFRQAITHGADRLIIAHNHPSGDVEPSDNDIKITQRLARAGEILNIPIVDHIIISRDNLYYSLAMKNRAHS